MVKPSRAEEGFPYWLLLLAGLVVWMFYEVAANDLYSQITATLSKGLRITVVVTLVGFAAACAMGLFLAVMSLSNSLILRQIARFYIEVVRGIPIIVLLL